MTHEQIVHGTGTISRELQRKSGCVCLWDVFTGDGDIGGAVQVSGGLEFERSFARINNRRRAPHQLPNPFVDYSECKSVAEVMAKVTQVRL